MLGRALDHIDWQPGATLAACAAVFISLVTVAAAAIMLYVSDAVAFYGSIMIAAVALYWLGSAGLAAVRRQRRQEAIDLEETVRVSPLERTRPKFSRNEACPCDSGRKVKCCHAYLAE